MLQLFLDTFFKNWATFCSSIWSHCLRGNVLKDDCKSVESRITISRDYLKAERERRSWMPALRRCWLIITYLSRSHSVSVTRYTRPFTGVKICQGVLEIFQETHKNLIMANLATLTLPNVSMAERSKLFRNFFVTTNRCIEVFGICNDWSMELFRYLPNTSSNKFRYCQS